MCLGFTNYSRRLVNFIITKYYSKVLQNRLYYAEYSEARVMKAIIRFWNLRRKKLIIDIIRKETTKAVKNTKTRVFVYGLNYCLSSKEEDEFSKIVRDDHPSLRNIQVMGASYSHDEIAIALHP